MSSLYGLGHLSASSHSLEHEGGPTAYLTVVWKSAGAERYVKLLKIRNEHIRINLDVSSRCRMGELCRIAFLGVKRKTGSGEGEYYCMTREIIDWRGVMREGECNVKTYHNLILSVSKVRTLEVVVGLDDGRRIRKEKSRIECPLEVESTCLDGGFRYSVVVEATPNLIEGEIDWENPITLKAGLTSQSFDPRRGWNSTLEPVQYW